MPLATLLAGLPDFGGGGSPSDLLLESGSHLLLETGDNLVLES